MWPPPCSYRHEVTSLPGLDGRAPVVLGPPRDASGRWARTHGSLEPDGARGGQVAILARASQAQCWVVTGRRPSWLCTIHAPSSLPQDPQHPAHETDSGSDLLALEEIPDRSHDLLIPLSSCPAPEQVAKPEERYLREHHQTSSALKAVPAAWEPHAECGADATSPVPLARPRLGWP
jgi:hypothetical protein